MTDEDKSQCEKLTAIMLEATEAVRAGKITPDIAKSMARDANVVRQTMRDKVLYQAARGDKPDVSFYN